jgi:hypothetical protein
LFLNFDRELTEKFAAPATRWTTRIEAEFIAAAVASAGDRTARRVSIRNTVRKKDNYVQGAAFEQKRLRHQALSIVSAPDTTRQPILYLRRN